MNNNPITHLQIVLFTSEFKLCRSIAKRSSIFYFVIYYFYCLTLFSTVNISLFKDILKNMPTISIIRIRNHVMIPRHLYYTCRSTTCKNQARSNTKDLPHILLIKK